MMKLVKTYREATLESEDSARSVRRYCKVNDISHLSDHEIESLAVEAITEVFLYPILYYLW